jgi:hypothetical protein
MEGTWNNNRAHYRCRFPAEYALANRIDHPLSVYLREDVVLEPLDGWLSGLFDSPHRNETIEMLIHAACREGVQSVDRAVAKARSEITEIETELEHYRAALKAGADPTVVAGWIAETKSRRAQAERHPKVNRPPDRMGKDEIAAIVRGLGDLLQVIRSAHPEDKAEVYRQLGVELTYQSKKHLVEATVSPPQLWSSRRVGGGTCNFAPRPLVVDSPWSELGRAA